MKLTLIVTLLILIAVPILSTQGQAVSEGSAVWIAGLRHDEALVGTFGAGLNLGGNLWEFMYADFGPSASGSINLEAVYLISIPNTGLYFGPIAGPDVHWENQAGDGRNPVAYIVGATGMALSYSFSPQIGSWAYYKNKYALKGDTAFEDRWIGGIGVFIRF